MIRLRKRVRIQLVVDDKILSPDTELVRKVMNILHEALPQEGYEVVGHIRINVEKDITE